MNDRLMPENLYRTLVFFIMLGFSSSLLAEDFLWVELLAEERQMLHFAYPTLPSSPVFYYAAWFERKGYCPELGNQAQGLKRMDNRYLPPNIGGYLCLVGSDKPLEPEWGQYQIMPEKDVLLNDEDDDSRSVTDDSGEVLPERRKKQCVFTVAADKGIKFCSLPL